MQAMKLDSLSSWRGPQRTWALGFHALALTGMAVSIYYVHATATLTLGGLEARFAGPETEQVATHSFLSLLQTIHTHLFTLTFLQLFLGGFFLLGSASRRWKAWLVPGGFGAVLLDQGALAASFKFGPGWSPLVMLGGILMTAILVTEALWNLKDLAASRR